IALHVLQKVSEWLRLLPFLGVLALLGYLAVRPFLPKKKQQKDSLINLKIQKENPKVVNEINIEDLCLTKAYCRCWRSKTFPVCDGSHNKHNELTGDNVFTLLTESRTYLQELSFGSTGPKIHSTRPLCYCKGEILFSRRASSSRTSLTFGVFFIPLAVLANWKNSLSWIIAEEQISKDLFCPIFPNRIKGRVY
uniref:CDGSH iron-sulfur domain-containing protein 2 n=1 Tax=Zonotrichia albicollis TaxID=44394 RepID=A0A8D2MDL6_ZONAL